MFGKSNRRDDVEAEFETILKDMRPTPNLIKVAGTMFQDAWEQVKAQISKRDKITQQEISKTQRDIDSLLERIIESDSPTIIQAYETKIKGLEEKRAQMAVTLGEKRPKRGHYSANVRTAVQFLLNPYKVWENGSFEVRRLVLRLAFAKRIPYSRIDGVRTAELSKPFQLIQGLREGNEGEWDLQSVMVGDNGLEPLTLSV